MANAKKNAKGPKSLVSRDAAPPAKGKKGGKGKGKKK